MILGIGSDLIDVRRIERTIERHGERFLDRIFTAAERAKAEGRARRVETYAKRFAAKEACAKALGTGLRAGVFWRDMGVVNLPSGRPTMKLTGGALARLKAITPAGCEARIDLTITDEGPMAQAWWSSRQSPINPRDVSSEASVLAHFRPLLIARPPQNPIFRMVCALASERLQGRGQGGSRRAAAAWGDGLTL